MVEFKEVLESYPTVNDFYLKVCDRQVIKPATEVPLVLGTLLEVFRNIEKENLSFNEWDDSLDHATVVVFLQDAEKMCTWLSKHGSSKIQHSVLTFKTHVLAFLVKARAFERIPD